MRKAVWAGLGAVGLALAIIVIVREQRGALAPMAAKLATAFLSPAAAGEPVPASRPHASTSLDTTSSRALPALPTVEVPMRPVHAVPDEAPPGAGIRPFDRDARASLTPVPSGLRPNPIFSGVARADGGTTLAVAGKEVRLFGVRAAGPRDRCGAAAGAGSCADAARDALSRRLRRSPRVSCQMPAGQIGKPGAVCIDLSGTDLGGFLVAEGLALADTNQSYEYFGAEGVARSFRRGLWRYR